MEIIISIAAKIAEYLVGQCLSQSFLLCNDIQNMKKQLTMLQAARDKVQNSVDAAIRSAEEIEIEVHKWLEKVDVTLEEAKDILEDEEKGNTRSSGGACLNLKQCHQQRKKAKKIVQNIDDALKTGNFDTVSHRPASHAIYVTFESRMSTVKGLMEALQDTNINVIGVWGMPGAGKTTIVTEVVWQAKEEKLFDEVAMAAVMQSSDLRRIQGEIADMLGLKFDVETVPGRAILLRERLKRNKKVLVILDDIWNKLDLEAIGIPCDGCKILLTSRDRDILSCEMNTQKKFELGVLSPDEAWSLFEKMAGDSLKDPNLRSIATQVAQVCAGLPLALVTVATALKDKSLFEWEDALQQLRRPSPVHLTGMQAAIYSKIELSYKHLGSPVVKSFFLLCSQIGPAIFYEDLVKYCFGMCLFPGIRTLEEARNKVYTLVRILKDSCLLLEDPRTSKYVRMHDLVRDVAILIAIDENKFTMRNDDPVKWPDEDALKMCTSMSVLARDIHELPDGLVCPKLRFLCVVGRDRDFKISEFFFKGMRELKVLDLTKMRLTSLPSSINLLTNLQTLCLIECVLKDIAVIGELKNLEILHLGYSEFTQLPQEIGLLTHLRMLDLSKCTKLEVIPPNVLSNLKQLEELYVSDSFTQWELEGVNNERASLAELKHLSLLTTLEVNIPNANMLPKNLLFKKLKRYQIFIGDVWDQFGKSESSRALKLKLNSSFELERGIKMLLSGIEDLCLDELKGAKSIISELDSKGFQQLKHLHVQNNSEMKYIIHSKGLGIADVVFPVLEIFSLKNMINLEEICHGEIPLTSFRNLSIVKVEHCEKLKFIFSSSIAKSLSQLQTLEIRECSIMGEIVEKEEGRIEDRDMKLFPQLRHLLLHCLPKLMSFLSTQNSDIIDAGEVIPQSEQVVFPNLETLELSSIHSEEILLHNQHRATSSFKLTDPRFQNLRILTVKGSGNLKYLLSSSTATLMIQLKYLDIEDCKVMEEVLLTEDLGEEEIIPKVLFPRLEDLILKDLPVLKRFCVGSDIKFPLLKDMMIEKCPKLESFVFRTVSSGMTLSKELKEVNSEEISQIAMQPLFNEEVVFPNLEKLELSCIDSEEILLQNQHRASSSFKLTNIQTASRFQNLCYLKVTGYANLKYLLSSSTARFMVQLKFLDIEECKVMEEIILIEDLGQEQTSPMVFFPQLEYLFLKDLPVLKIFCVGSNVRFPYLKSLQIEQCPKLESFIFKPVSSSMTLSKELKEMNSEEISHTAMQPLFNEEVAFPSLETLLLDQCVLEDIVMIGELRNLKILSLRQSNVKQLPRETRLLTRLRILSLSNCTELKVIPPNVLSCLIQLEELYVGNSFTQWDVEGLNNERASLAELKHLSRLTTLEVDIPDANMLPKDLLFEKLQRYQIFVGDVWDWSDCPEHSRALKLKLNSSFHLERGIKMLLNGIEYLCLDELKGVKSVIYELDMTGFQKLKHLHVQNNVEIKYIINSTGMVISDVVFPVLEILSLKNMINLEEICHGQIPLASFRNLSIMKVEHCEKLKFVFSSTIAKGLPQLQEMVIKECSIMGAIIIKEEGEIEDRDMILFPQLRLLELHQLPKLVSLLNTQKSVINDAGEIIPECELDFHMPILQEQVVFPKLEALKLSNIHSEKILQNQHRASSSFKLTDPRFQNLRDLTVKGIGNLKYLLSSSTATFMVQLKYLDIEDCKVMEEILLTEDIGEEAIIPKVLFPQLEDLFLQDLPVLKRFCIGSNIRFPSLTGMAIEQCPKLESFMFKPVSSEEISRTAVQPLFNEKVVFPKLEALKLSNIHSEEILQNQHRASSFLILTNPRFQNLRDLTVKGIGNLKYLLSSSTATFMVQLKYLDIEDCKVMEEILLIKDLGEEEIIPKLLFPQLEDLFLQDLPVLKRFCRGSNIRFPSLTSMTIEQCPKLESFIFKPVSSEEISRTAMQPLFNEKVAFPSLESLTIMHMENLKIIWHDQLAEDSFFKLHSLFVHYCENLVNIFESNMLTRFQSLERLEVSYCGSLQEVFELQRLDVRESHAVTAIPLKRLVLHRLPKMKQVWNKDPQGIFSFQNLQFIGVLECESLKSLFPASVARCLMQLEDLRIDDCGVEEIVSREEIAEAAARFVFPKVTHLMLHKLPKLKWFCRGVHTSEWPLLKKLEVSECDQIEIFASKVLNFQETVEQSKLETSIQQPFFLVEEDTLFPNLEVLTLGGNLKMKEMQCDQLLKECFYKLKDLSIVGYLAVSDWINFLKRLHSLEKLFVWLTSWEEIFPYEQLFDQENNATILAQLRELELYELPMLTHLWKEDTQPSPILYNLENLIVSFCDKLKILVPSSISFQNLTNLEILKCHGLINLVTSSTAKSLVQLKKMSVSECERITEVVVGEGGEASEVITFTQLIYLKLDSLPNLASFCPESYSFNFPSLEEVIVRQCPEMKTFSYGALGTPKLKKVQSTQEDEWHWKVDLNTTIRCLTQ